MKKYYVVKLEETYLNRDGSTDTNTRYYNKGTYSFDRLFPDSATHFEDPGDAEYYAELEDSDPKYSRFTDGYSITVEEWYDTSAELNRIAGFDVEEIDLDSLLTEEAEEAKAHGQRVSDYTEARYFARALLEV